MQKSIPHVNTKSLLQMAEQIQEQRRERKREKERERRKREKEKFFAPTACSHFDVIYNNLSIAKFSQFVENFSNFEDFV